MANPFDREHIVQQWQPLNWEAFDPLSESTRRYVAYYGLNFAEHLPNLEHGFGYFEAAGHQLSVHAWRPREPRGTVLVCHGYFDHVGLYRHIIGHVLELGYAVLAYDLPGHGLSSGRAGYIRLSAPLRAASNGFSPSTPMTRTFWIFLKIRIRSRRAGCPQSGYPH